MKKIAFFLLFGCHYLMAQQSINSLGGNATGSNGSFSYSVGQINYVFSNGSNGIVTQGVQQAFEIAVLGTNEISEISLELLIYPNPTTNILFIKNENSNLEFNYQLFDVTGKLIAISTKLVQTDQIDMTPFNTGVYILKILENNNLIKSLKNKTNMRTNTQNIARKIIFLFSFFCILNANAQAPNKFSFQAVVRNTSNQLIANQQVGVKISLMSVVMGTENAEYVEMHTILTNSNGLLSLKVGDGSLVSGDFTTAMYSNASSKKIKCEIDPTGGTNYTIISNEQLLSVPYALKSNTASYAENVDSVPVKYYIVVYGIYPSNSNIGADTMGAIVAHAGNFPNANGGYLPCDGRSMSIAQNQALFSIIGTTYGGDGLTTFNLPNLNGKILKGY